MTHNYLLADCLLVDSCLITLLCIKLGLLYYTINVWSYISYGFLVFIYTDFSMSFKKFPKGRGEGRGTFLEGGTTSTV